MIKRKIFSVSITKIVMIWPEAMATRFSSDQAMESGYDADATKVVDWKKESITRSSSSPATTTALNEETNKETRRDQQKL